MKTLEARMFVHELWMVYSKSLPVQSLKLMLHNLLIYPNIIYCNTVRFSCNNSIGYPLFILHKSILRAICVAPEHGNTAYHYLIL